MILPKGIVLNTNYIYEQVAKYDVVPPEKIWEYWHVYTTTHRKLIDPTANRLENFWWHVMGSDRRLLSGKTLARLFEDISNGPTIVKLRGPPNRYEGPSIPSYPVTKKGSATSSNSKSSHVGQGPEEEQDTPVKPLPASSSKPPPAHPILKKPKHPSASGSRPTARFASPPESDGDDVSKDSEAASSSSTLLNSAAESKACSSSKSKDEDKKSIGGTTKKKTTAFVVSSSSKRRPAMPRRQSSQSSAVGSDTGSKDGSITLGSKYLGAARPVSPIAERSGVSEEEAGGRLSAKAAGKRPAVRSTPPTKASGSKSSTSQSANAQEGRTVVQGESVDFKERKPNLVAPRSEMNLTGEGTSRRRSEAQEQTRPQAPPMVRSRSDMDTPRPGSRELSLRRRPPPHGLISSSTTITSNVAATGTILEFDDNAPAQEATSALNTEDQVEDPETGLRRSATSLQFTPTQPSPTPAVPLGRSKSQLTLLLEREKIPRR